MRAKATRPWPSDLMRRKHGSRVDHARVRKRQRDFRDELAALRFQPVLAKLMGRPE